MKGSAEVYELLISMRWSTNWSLNPAYKMMLVAVPSTLKDPIYWEDKILLCTISFAPPNFWRLILIGWFCSLEQHIDNCFKESSRGLQRPSGSQFVWTSKFYGETAHLQMVSVCLCLHYWRPQPPQSRPNWRCHIGVCYLWKYHLWHLIQAFCAFRLNLILWPQYDDQLTCLTVSMDNVSDIRDSYGLEEVGKM